MVEENELNTFISKFKQLWKFGLAAHLDLDSSNGKAWVGLFFILEMHQVLFVIIQIEVKLFRRLEIVLQNKDEEIEELLLEKVKIMRLIQKK